MPPLLPLPISTSFLGRKVPSSATLDDLVSHKDITSTIQNFIDKNRLPHLLFYGPPGTGKNLNDLGYGT